MPYEPKPMMDVTVEALGATWHIAPPNDAFADAGAMQKPSAAAHVLFGELLLGWEGVEVDGKPLEFNPANVAKVPLLDRLHVAGKYMLKMAVVDEQGEASG